MISSPAGNGEEEEGLRLFVPAEFEFEVVFCESWWTDSRLARKAGGRAPFCWYWCWRRGVVMVLSSSSSPASAVAAGLPPAFPSAFDSASASASA